MNFILKPRYVCIDKYDACIEKIVDYYKTFDEIVSIYQIGSITTPGISDIDILFVFKNGVIFDIEPRKILSVEEKYLAVHNFFGIYEQDFSQNSKYQIVQISKLLYGKDIKRKQLLKRDQLIDLEKQLGLEYLIQFYISLTIQLSYNIIKVRPCLLHIKGIKLDYSLLKIIDHDSIEYVKKINYIRENWFNDEDENMLQYHLEIYYGHLENLLNELLMNKTFYLPSSSSEINLSRNIIIKQSKKLHFKRKRMFPLDLFFINSAKYYNLLDRFNKFHICLPFKQTKEQHFLLKCYQVHKRLKEINSKKFPYFYPLVGSSLNIN
jgi:hypothetical protein